jgi:hypothetical protein
MFPSQLPEQLVKLETVNTDLLGGGFADEEQSTFSGWCRELEVLEVVANSPVGFRGVRA